MAKLGRPTKYSEALVDRLCELISNSNKGLHSICGSDDSFPDPSNVYRWLDSSKSFRNKYARARQDQADFLADEIIDIADETSNDTLVTEEGKEYANSEWINRSRLRVDARKWKASKLYPKKYGDKVDIEHSGQIETITVVRKKIGGNNT